MADRFPLILNTSANQIQEIASGDTLDLTNNNISNAGVITATSFSGPVVAGAGVSNITAGIGTYTNLRVGGNTTFSEDLVVTGNARVTGILTVGTSSIVLNDGTDTIKVGSQNLHSAGFEVNQINASGIITATEADINGDLDVDGHTNLDNVSIAGITTMSGDLRIESALPSIYLTDNNTNPDYLLYNSNGSFEVRDVTNNGTRLQVASSGNVNIFKDLNVTGDLDVDGHTNLDNVSVAGVTTFTGNSTFTGNIDANGELDVDGPTHLDYVSISGVTTHSDTVHIIDDKVLMFGSGGDSTIEYDENGNDQLTIAGAVTRFTNTTQSTSKDTGSVIFEGGIGVEKDLSIGGNVSIGGTLTYEDVTNIDSVGIVTAREGVFLPDLKQLKIGNTSAAPDLYLWHNSSTGNSNISNKTGDLFIQGNNGSGTVVNQIAVKSNAAVELNHQGNKKLSTIGGGNSANGIEVFGNASNSAVRLSTSDGTLRGIVYANSSNLVGFLGNNGSWALSVQNAGGNTISYNHFLPSTDSSLDLGTSSTRWRNVYADTLYGNGANLTGLNTDLVNDTSPQLGADLDTNSHHILIDDDHEVKWGANSDIRIFHANGNANFIQSYNDVDFRIHTFGTTAKLRLQVNESQNSVVCTPNGATELYHSGNKKFETTSSGTHHTGFTHTFGASGAVPTLKAGGANTDIRLEAVGAGGWVEFMTTGTSRWRINGTHGHFYPVTNNTYDIGTSSERVRNIYTNDLNLSNEGGANDVDNTWGNYTIQEGESDLFLINNRNGKKYKFNLTEVS